MGQPMAPTIDPNAWAMKMREAKQRAAELRASRSSGVEQPFYSAPPPPSRSSLNAHGFSANSHGYEGERSQSGMGSYEGGGGVLMPQGTGGLNSLPPVVQQQASSNTRPGYRGMISYGSGAAQGSDVDADIPAQIQASYRPPTHQQHHYPQLQQQPPPSDTTDEAFLSMLRSESSATRGSTGGTNTRGGGSSASRRPAWNSDLSSDSSPLDAPAASESLPSGPMSTKERLARMRNEMKAPPMVESSVAKSYGGIMPAERENDPYAAPASSFSSSPATSSSDFMAPRTNAPAVTRTGLKPTVVKSKTSSQQFSNSNSRYGEGGFSGSSSSSSNTSFQQPSQPPSTWGNDDEPVGRGGSGVGGGDLGDSSNNKSNIPASSGSNGRASLGGARSGIVSVQQQAPLPPPYVSSSWGNDDQPIGKSGGGGSGGYKIDYDSLGPDALPPSSSPFSSNFPPPSHASQGPLALLKAKRKGTGSAGGSSRSRTSSMDSGDDSAINQGQVNSSATGTYARYTDDRGSGGMESGRLALSSRQRQSQPTPPPSSYSDNYDAPAYSSQHQQQLPGATRGIIQSHGPSAFAPPAPLQYNSVPERPIRPTPPSQETADSEGPAQLYPCSTCGRKFGDSALEKHEVCALGFASIT